MLSVLPTTWYGKPSVEFAFARGTSRHLRLRGTGHNLRATATIQVSLGMKQAHISGGASNMSQDQADARQRILDAINLALMTGKEQDLEPLLGGVWEAYPA